MNNKKTIQFEGKWFLAKKIIVPEGITHIDARTFWFCTNVTEIILPKSIQDISYDAFERLSNVNIIIDEENENYSSTRNAIYSKDGSVLKIYYSKEENVVVSDGVKVIDSRAFSCCEKCKSVILPKGLISIENEGFYQNYSISYIEIPDGVKYIGEKAFFYCKNLNFINIPNSISEVKASTFKFCSSLKKVILNDNIKKISESAFAECTSLEDIELPNSLNTIESNAFSFCKSLVKINLPNSLINIGCQAFYHCDSIENIEIPQNITIIEEGIFCDCINLRKIQFPDNITSIQSSAFAGCIKLSEIKLPSKIKDIKKYTFFNCQSLKDIDIHDNITNIEEGAFKACISLETVTLPPTVLSIKGELFSGCENLTYIKFSEEVSNIEKGAFEDCKSLNYIKLPPHITKIKENTFKNCTNIKQFDLHDQITLIENGAFQGCTSLQSIEMPNSIIEIGKEAFANCTRLKTIEIPNNVTTINQNIFSGCIQLEHIKIGKNINKIYSPTYSFFENPISIDISLDNPYYEYINGLIVEKKTRKIIEYYDSVNRVDIEVPAYIKSSGVKAFHNIHYLKNIYFLNPKFDLKKTSIEHNGEFFRVYFESKESADNKREGKTTVENINNIIFVEPEPYYLKEEDTILVNDRRLIVNDLNYYEKVIIAIDNVVITDKVSNVKNIVIDEGVKNIYFYNKFELNTKILEVNTKIKDAVYLLLMCKYRFPNLDILYIGYENPYFYKAENSSFVICYNQEGPTELDDDEFYPSLRKWVNVNQCVPRENIKYYKGVYFQVTKDYCKVLKASIKSKKIEIISNINGIPVTIIGPGAFKDYEGTEINLPNTIQEIGSDAFRNNKNLSYIIIPERVKEMGSMAFLNTKDLTIYVIGVKGLHLWRKRWNPENNIVKYVKCIEEIGCLEMREKEDLSQEEEPSYHDRFYFPNLYDYYDYRRLYSEYLKY